ncbi:hypothetical protein [Primorskyibacter sp. S87]|uniref:hypothetical protein n=1 Tax=Primorskyibacter sp. S87 TaxID=3415126 RepID=UPI003C7B6213
MKPMTIALFSTLTLSTVAFAETMPGEALLLLDGDGDGTVSFDEFNERMNTLFGGMDTNQNGRLERSETESFMSKDIFDATDINGSGTITKGEYDAQIRKDFEGADRDGDGTLD